jgi:glycosyltransferase involved in cell wall biosynthesis
METLSKLLIKEKYKVYKSSSKINKIIRLLDMCFAVVKSRNKVDYILIDTFSTINFYYAFVVSQLARILNIKYIPILHGGDLPKRIKKSKWMSNLIFNHSYKNIAPSNYLKSEFEKRNYTTSFIPNILEIEKYDFVKRNALSPKLLWVRAFRHLYNPILAIEVLNLLKKEYPKAILCMIGPVKDDSFEVTKELVKKHKLEDSVEFTGVLSKEKWHNKSKDFDIFINTTNFDNTPVSVMEAMALGLTIVSTNVGGLPYLIDNNVEGVLIDKNNPEQMTKAIIKLLKEENKELSINAREKAESFGWGIVKEKWLSILKQ